MGSCCSTTTDAHGASAQSRDGSETTTSRGADEESAANDSLPPLSMPQSYARRGTPNVGRGTLRQTFTDRAFHNKKLLMMMPPALHGEGSAGTGSIGSGELTLRGVSLGTPLQTVQRQHRPSSDGSGRHAISSERETSTTFDGGEDEPRPGEDERAIRVPSARSLLATRSLNFSATFLSVDEHNSAHPSADWAMRGGPQNSSDLSGSAEYRNPGVDGSAVATVTMASRARRRSEAIPTAGGGNSLSLSGAQRLIFGEASLTASQVMSSSRCSAGGGPRRIITARPSSFASVLSPEDQERSRAAMAGEPRAQHDGTVHQHPQGLCATPLPSDSSSSPMPVVHACVPCVVDAEPLMAAPPRTTSRCHIGDHCVRQPSPVSAHSPLRRSGAVVTPNRASSPLSVRAAPHRQQMHTRESSALSQTAVSFSVVQSVQEFGEYVDEGEYSSSSDPLE